MAHPTPVTLLPIPPRTAERNQRKGAKGATPLRYAYREMTAGCACLRGETIIDDGRKRRGGERCREIARRSRTGHGARWMNARIHPLGIVARSCGPPAAIARYTSQLSVAPFASLRLRAFALSSPVTERGVAGRLLSRPQGQGQRQRQRQWQRQDYGVSTASRCVEGISPLAGSVDMTWVEKGRQQRHSQAPHSRARAPARARARWVGRVGSTIPLSRGGYDHESPVHLPRREMT
jgi:hypothetical protein